MRRACPPASTTPRARVIRQEPRSSWATQDGSYGLGSVQCQRVPRAQLRGLVVAARRRRHLRFGSGVEPPTGWRAPIPELPGKRVSSAGASSGTGVAVADLLACEGASLALSARRASGLEVAARGVREHGGTAHAIVATWASARRPSAPSPRRWLRSAASTSSSPTPPRRSSGASRTARPYDFDRTVDAAFRGVVDVIRAALPHLERTGGPIVVAGSIAG